MENVSTNELEQILKTLCTSRTLRDLEFKGNIIRGEAYKQLIQVPENVSNLTCLKLGSSRLGDDPDSLRDLLESIKYASKVKELDLSDNRLGEHGAKMVADYIKGDTCLETLDISFNKINKRGAKHIASIIGYHKALLSLDISSNDIQDGGFLEFSPLIK
jgi:Ran GTPase-activating protein (RanGAP) involved in mRNA processing and transport